MRGGKLRRVVTIQQPTVAQTVTGNPRPSWANLTGAVNIYAQIEENTGREQIVAGQVNPQRPVTLRIRYIAGITAQMRVIFGARTLQIASVVNINERDRELELTCLERA
jgi:SPP1 family predicted phage head-tail adaptor